MSLSRRRTLAPRSPPVISTSSTGRPVFNVKGAVSEQRLGNDVAGLGDVNGDGFEDFIVAAYLTDLPVGASAGAAHVIFGTGAPFPTDFDIATLDGSKRVHVQRLGCE